MKKFFAMLLLVCMILSLAACGQQAAPAPAAEQPAAEEPAAEAEAPAEAAEEPTAEEPAAAAEYKLGMGVSLNMNSSKAGNAQVDATVAAVVTDAEGKIVAVKLDVAQNKMNITDGQVETDKEFKTKLELGDDYNMVKFSDAVAEWYDQAAAFEAYVIGKTADEVAGTETVVNDEGHTVVTVDTLDASVLKATNAVVIMNRKDAEKTKPSPCIHCGRCVAVCPLGLNPTAFARAMEMENEDERAALLQKEQVSLCMECGCCSYVCPAHRPLAENNSAARRFIRGWESAKKEGGK
ncbi:MAG: 4Fe-4S dicluster domain-containing protein [Eubacteriales bacterium]|nr:4Fe-4S dicluster domain-containing protein [Eubacteriales bacterium]